MSIAQEIEQISGEIKTDAYPMSIGEVMSLYRDEELDIHPEFQRVYRWSLHQRTKLIESILLGIPIPSIFVSQRPDGVWDVVDGVQRLSTIFWFTNMLRDESGHLVKPEPLLATEYLPSLEGIVWENEDGEEHPELPMPLRLAFKRQKLSFSIVSKESDPNTKFELFQRLNTLGSNLSDQEIRNCMLVMINREFFEWLKELSEHEAFLQACSISENQQDQQYHMELALRFLALHDIDPALIGPSVDIGQFTTKAMKEMATDPNFDRFSAERIFRKSFDLLSEALPEGAFSRYDSVRDRFTGRFLISVFEALALGVGFHFRHHSNYSPGPAAIRHAAKELWRDNDFAQVAGSGSRASSRLPVLIPLGRRLCAP